MSAPGGRGLWLFLGDSITQGMRHTHGARSYPQLLEEHVRGDRGAVEHLFVTAAVNGSTVGDFVSSDSTDLWRLQPTVCSIMFGVNDSKAGEDAAVAYGAALAEVVHRASVSGAVVALHTPTPVTGEQRVGLRSSLPRYAQVARRVAADLGVTLIDHEKPFAAAPDATALMDDDLHPNGLGHRLIADTTIESVRRMPELGWI